MRYIQATLTFDATAVNMGRKGKLGVWRIARTREVSNPLQMRVDDFTESKHTPYGNRKVLRMMVARHYQRSAMVSPVKLAMEYLKLRYLNTIIYEQSGEIIYFGEAART